MPRLSVGLAIAEKIFAKNKNSIAPPVETCRATLGHMLDGYAGNVTQMPPTATRPGPPCSATIKVRSAATTGWPCSRAARAGEGWGRQFRWESTRCLPL